MWQTTLAEIKDHPPGWSSFCIGTTDVEFVISFLYYSSMLYLPKDEFDKLLDEQEQPPIADLERRKAAKEDTCESCGALPA